MPAGTTIHANKEIHISLSKGKGPTRSMCKYMVKLCMWCGKNTSSSDGVLMHLGSLALEI